MDDVLNVENDKWSMWGKVNVGCAFAHTHWTPFSDDGCGDAAA